MFTVFGDFKVEIFWVEPGKSAFQEKAHDVENTDQIVLLAGLVEIIHVLRAKGRVDQFQSLFVNRTGRRPFIFKVNIKQTLQQHISKNT